MKDKIYHLVGDDSLFDDIDAMIKVKPEADVRYLIIEKIEEWLEHTDDFVINLNQKQ